MKNEWYKWTEEGEESIAKVEGAAKHRDDNMHLRLPVIDYDWNRQGRRNEKIWILY